MSVEGSWIGKAVYCLSQQKLLMPTVERTEARNSVKEETPYTEMC